MYLYEILNEFQIPKKSVNLITMSWHDSNGKVKIQGHLAEAFETEKGFRQGDALSTILFDIILKKAIRIGDNVRISYNTT